MGVERPRIDPPDTRKRRRLVGERRLVRPGCSDGQMFWPMVDRIVLICVPRKTRAAMAITAMRARIRAYSARPCPPSSLRRTLDSQVVRAAMLVLPPFRRDSRRVRTVAEHCPAT